MTTDEVFTIDLTFAEVQVISRVFALMGQQLRATPGHEACAFPLQALEQKILQQTSTQLLERLEREREEGRQG